MKNTQLQTDCDALLNNIYQQLLTLQEKYKTEDVIKDLGTDDVFEIGKIFRNWLIDFMSSGPVVKILIEGVHAIDVVRKIVGDKFAVPVFVVVSPWWDTQITEQMKNVASRNGYHWLELPEHGTDYNVDNSAALRALPNEKGVKLIADSIVSEFRKAGLQVGN